jgi:hypothetical protein
MRYEVPAFLQAGSARRAASTRGGKTLRRGAPGCWPVAPPQRECWFSEWSSPENHRAYLSPSKTPKGAQQTAAAASVLACLHCLAHHYTRPVLLGECPVLGRGLVCVCGGGGGGGPPHTYMCPPPPGLGGSRNPHPGGPQHARPLLASSVCGLWAGWRLPVRLEGPLPAPHPPHVPPGPGHGAIGRCM